VELWPEDDPDNRFFDPIAILGAETPKRALGMTRYQASTHKKQPIRYEMGAEPAAAESGGHNTFIPSMGTKKKKKPQSYSERDDNMEAITPEVMAQVIEAAMPLITAAIQEQLGALHENDALAQATPEPVLDAGMPVEGAEPMGGGMPTPEAPPMGGPELDPMAAALEEPAADPIAPTLDEGLELDDEPSPFAKYARGKIDKYMMDDESEHKTDAMEYAMKFANGLDDDDKAELDTMLDGGDTDESKAFYGKIKCAMSGEDEDQMTGGVKAAAKYAKAQTKIRTLQAQNDELHRKSRADEQAIKHSMRSQVLEGLSQDFVLQTDDEMAHCQDMTDDQFEKHVERIPQMYQAATGPQIARHAVGPDLRPQDTKDDECSAKAVKLVDKYRKTHPRTKFKEVFQSIKATGDWSPETAAK
jgi:hypothetical protein